ncbi:hypothetical protein ACHMW7_09150 [Aminobacter sp. UC22_36]|uniref:hypothetical protein n=1 Tax=Aminobacter sp. UC22_36 TaxID=3374549 RepID=UPI003756F29B
MSGLNEGIATTLGLPIDMANVVVGLGMKGINAVAGTNLQPSAEPLGGSAGLKRSLVDIGSIRPETHDPGQRFLRRASQEVGSVVVPGLNAVSKAQAPVREGAKILMTSLGSGGGAAAANQIAPDNPWAELAGQVLGGLSVGAPMVAAGRYADKRAIQAAIPTDGELRMARDAAVKRVDATGATYTPEAMSELSRRIKDDVTSAEFDARLQPRADAMMQIIKKQLDGKPQSPAELTKLRKSIEDNLLDKTGTTAERSHATKMIDNIDGFVGAAGPRQISARNVPEADTAIREAFDLETRLRKYEPVAEALNRTGLRAGSRGKIDDAALDRLHAVYNDPQKSGRYSPVERELMERAITGTTAQKLGRQIGTLAPSGSGLQQAVAMGANALNPVKAILPGAGMVAKFLTDRARGKNVDELVQTILSGAPVKKVRLLNDSARRVAAALMAAQAANANAD